MNKLRLDVDSLTVQTFSTAPAPRDLGTVRGNEGTIATCDTSPECDTWYGPTCRHADTCNGADSCDVSCQGTCFDETACIDCPE